jgi:hypothetical protein
MLVNENLKISEINIKNYIPFSHKQLLCEKVIDASTLVDENGIVSCNYFLKKLATDINILSFYTDLQFNESTEEDYDFLIKSGLFDNILYCINDNDLDFIDEMINKEIAQKIMIGNSLGNVVASKLEKLIEKIPTDKQLKSLSKSLIKDVNKLNWDKVPMLKQMWETANGKAGSDGDGK